MIPGICKYNLILHFIRDLLRVKRPSEPDPIVSPEGFKSAQVLAGRTCLGQKRLIHAEHTFNCLCGVVSYTRRSSTRTMPAFFRWSHPLHLKSPRLRLSQRFVFFVLFVLFFLTLAVCAWPWLSPQLWTCFSSNQGGHSLSGSNKSGCVRFHLCSLATVVHWHKGRPAARLLLTWSLSHLFCAAECRVFWCPDDQLVRAMNPFDRWNVVR